MSGSDSEETNVGPPAPWGGSVSGESLEGGETTARTEPGGPSGLSGWDGEEEPAQGTGQVREVRRRAWRTGTVGVL